MALGDASAIGASARASVQTTEAYMPKLRSGHAPGHVRDTFVAAVEAFEGWEAGEAEPTVEYEIGYVPRPISLSRACGLVWNCTDIMPGLWFQTLLDCGLDINRQTYAACARAMFEAVNKNRQAAV
jgi:hypothetical protein